MNKSFLITLLLSFLFLKNLEATQLSIDILVFSPHPDDETLCCAGTIIKAIKANKKIKVVFLTNGDAYSLEESAPADYIALGKRRQGEALKAVKKLGLRKEDALFLSYPDKDLAPIWEETYTDSPYHKKNLLLDIKDILKRYNPQKIYTLHLLDAHPDHSATTKFVLLALDELRNEKENKWVDSIDIFYYCVHKPDGDFSQPPNYKENIADFKKQKSAALEEYVSQTNLEYEKEFFQDFIKDEELFWNTANNITPKEYLKQLEDEWFKIGKVMHKKGYNLNFAPVIDVAENINCLDNPLARKERIYSENPHIVSKLALATIKGMNRADIIPVVKHFPGLGRSQKDTHLRLPKILSSKKELYQKELIPYKELIKSKANFWVMIDHALYPCLDDKPASLSYKINTELLRNELGFKGIVIVDELAVMQALREYAFHQGIKFSIGEIVVKTFKAGTDFALIYVIPGEAEEVIANVIEAIKEAIRKGELREEDIDISVARILREKERIFNKPLRHFLKEMTLEEKITQKLIIDAYTEKEIEVFKRYKLGGVQARKSHSIEQLQRNSKIPMFISCQHEGGKINEQEINIYTESFYFVGKEFEKLLAKRGKLQFLPSKWIPRHKEEESSFDFSKLNKEIHKRAIYSLVETLDELIRLYSQLLETGYITPNPSNVSPLTIHQDGRFEIKPYDDSPIEWLEKFPEQTTSLFAYQVFKKVFKNWEEEQKKSKVEENLTYISSIISRLKSLKEKITDSFTPSCRVLCLATHPDDEDAEALVYLKNKFDCSTYVLLATRGEGGENEIGPELYEDLGFLRVEEMEKSASILGVDKVYYLDEPDFGYTSSLEEVWKEWNKKDALRKIVYFYRLVRPHIIITKHTDFDEHAQHRGFIILAKEGFDLAADSKVYPQMIKKGFLPYKPLKFYQRCVNEEFDLAINAKEFIPFQGKTYEEVAINSLKQHQTQGNWEWIEKIYRAQKSREIFYKLVKSNSSFKCKDFICREETERNEEDKSSY